MRCMRCLNHDLQHDASKKPSELPTTTTTTTTLPLQEQYQAGGASLWPLATVAGAETLYIYIKQTCYEYEVCGGFNHKNQQGIQLWHQEGHLLSGSIEQISGWSCILMTTSHCSRCWIALYMYKEDLMWVWREWGASNIRRTNRDPPATPRRSTLSPRG
jgi:hypothetical protein